LKALKSLIWPQLVLFIENYPKKVKNSIKKPGYSAKKNGPKMKKKDTFEVPTAFTIARNP
jgi:hypothetical protein